MSILRASASIGGLTMVSRVFGFVRDMMIASFLGAGILSDAFLVAFKMPNFMRRLFAEGAFNAAFLPLYAGMLATDGQEPARRFVEEIQAVLVMILIILTGLALWFMPALMGVLAPGFDKDPAKYHLTITLTRITFPYLFFISLVSLQGGILNSADRFIAVAATPIVMNICLIGAMLVITPFVPTPAHAMAIGVLVSGVAQYLWLLYYCRKAGMSPRFIRPRLTPHVRLLLTQIAPAALGSSVVQINMLVDTMIASLVPRAVSFLYYADRISELPLGVIGIAVSTALLPVLSRRIKLGELEEARHTQNRALELSLFFGLPAAMALIVIPQPIIATIYQRGAFTAADTFVTYRTLIAYAVGLPAFLAVKIFASTFYANRDTRAPVRIAIYCVLVNLFFNVIFLIPLGSIGFALATSISGWINAIFLWALLRRRQLFTMDVLFAWRIKRIALASAGMGVALLMAAQPLAPYLNQGHTIRIVALAALMATGLVAYGAALALLRFMPLSHIKTFVKRR